MPKIELDSVKEAKRTMGNNRAFDVLWEAQQYWMAMETFRQDRERNHNYTNGRQWEDYICVDGKMMKEKDYIESQGNVPLKNNLIRRMVQAVLGVYRSQYNPLVRHETVTNRSMARPCLPCFSATCSSTVWEKSMPVVWKSF